jgi:hypothetical protein
LNNIYLNLEYLKTIFGFNVQNNKLKPRNSATSFPKNKAKPTTGKRLGDELQKDFH